MGGTRVLVPPFLDWGYHTSTLRSKKDTGEEFAVIGGDLRRLNYIKTIFSRGSAPDHGREFTSRLDHHHHQQNPKWRWPEECQQQQLLNLIILYCIMPHVAPSSASSATCKLWQLASYVGILPAGSSPGVVCKAVTNWINLILFLLVLFVLGLVSRSSN